MNQWVTSKVRFLAILAVCCVSVTTIAQPWYDGPEVQTNPEISDPVVPFVIDVNLADLAPIPQWKPGDPIKEIPRRSYGTVPDYIEPHERDTLLEIQAQVTARHGGGFGTTITNMDGQGFSGVNPPDTVGDVGMDYYIQAINRSSGSGGTAYTIHNKSDGSIAAGPFTLNGFAPCSGSGDPIVLYDEMAQRWLLAEFGDGNSICVLISQTSDPIAGGWFEYGFSTPNFPDYPKLGVWNNAYVMTTNESGPSPIYAFDRASMLTGAAATSQRFSVPDLGGFNFQALTPADSDGDAPPPGSPAFIMRHRDDEPHNPGSNDPNQDFLELYEFTIDWVTPANSMLVGPFTIAVAEFDSSLCGLTSFSCMQQPSGPQLDPLREVVMFRLAYRNFSSHEVLIGNLVTDVDGNDTGGIRWFELRKSARGPGSWALFQEGTYAPDSESRWMGAIAMDESGNIALGYNVSSGSVNPGLRYAGRLSGDPLGTIPHGEHSMIEGTASNGSNRYGDYAQMSVDPADGCTFWFTGEYNSASNWSTRIASFRFDACGCEALPPGNVMAVANGDNQIDVTWDAVAGATSYSVYRALDSCPTGAFELIASNVLTTSYSDTTVSGNATYAYAIKNYDGGLDCNSPLSDCADATATGDCLLPPTFGGVTSVTNQALVDCTLRVDWNAATDLCASAGISYNIYRSETSGFVPGAGNLIATCVSDLFYLDTAVDPGVTYYYIVRVEDQTGNGSGPCASGNLDTNTTEQSGAATGPDQIAFEDDMEGGTANWSAVDGPGEPGGHNPWVQVTSTSQSPITSWFCDDESTTKDQVLEMVNPAAINNPGAVLEFWHNHNTENNWDGGVLEYSTDGGSSWFDILAGDGATVPANSGRIPENGYVGTLNSSANPLGSRNAWFGNSGGWIRTSVDLTEFNGTNVQFRWRLGCDASVSAEGWYVDDVRVFVPTSCETDGCPSDFGNWPMDSLLILIDCISQGNL